MEDPKNKPAASDDDEESEEEVSQETLDMGLYNACKDNMIQEAREFLDRRANPLYDKDGWNAVLWAACNGSDKMIRLLHQYGATASYIGA